LAGRRQKTTQHVQKVGTNLGERVLITETAQRLENGGMSVSQHAFAIDSMRRLFDSGTAIGQSDRQLLDRFLATHDEVAFEAILRRHGPMVLAVCRRLIRDQNDVDDAFQATFLILVKKAAAIRDRDVLANWLYGVARRVAVRASAMARRRQSRERMMAEDVPGKDPRIGGPEQRELRSLVDAELARLPQRFRAPLILCDVEGQTHEQAAAEIGCPVGTIKSRLARGRERLRAQLVRRGMSSSPAALASFFAAEHPGAIPQALIQLTIPAASRLAAGSAIMAAALSPEAAALTKGVILQMLLKKLSVGAAALSVAIVAAGVTAVVFAPMMAAQRNNGQPALKRDAQARFDAVAKNRAGGKAIATDQGWSTPAVKGVERFRLANGLKVMLRPIKGTNEVALVVVYNIGSDHDPAGRSGIAHLVEHVYVTAAAGSAKARAVEEFAAQYPSGANGQTGDRYTVFSGVFPAKNIDQEIADAAARMADLRVTTADLEREKPRLLEELENMFVRFPALAAQNNARELIRPTPRGGRHGGVPDQVRALTPSDIQSYWKRFYKPANAILALAGNLDGPAVRKSIEDHFANLIPGEKPPAAGEPGKPAAINSEKLNVVSPRVAQDERLACIAYPAPMPANDLYAPFLVLVARLWGNAEQLGGGRAGEMPTFFTPIDDGAFLSLSSPVRTGESPGQAFGRLEKYVRETIEPALGGQELAVVRQQFGFLLGTMELPDNLLAQNPYGVCFSLARREQLGLDAAQLDRKLGGVTEKQMRVAAKEFFDQARRVQTFVSEQK
jgi:zinc protease